jgi:hypothetical protein|nr:MAG TPA: hypothetical protein [Caudoviricetes sp.]
MWVVIHEIPLQAHGNFGAIAQCLEWWGNCIGNNKKGNIKQTSFIIG